MISDRTKASLSLYLTLHDTIFLFKLYDRHSIALGAADLQSPVNLASPEQLLNLLEHMISTSRDLRYRISPRYRHDELWKDLIQCLRLDGYIIDDKHLIPIDPSIEGVEPVEDEFTLELQRSGLSEAEEITGLLNNSADDFRKTPPDYNGCLTNARVALETLAKSMARFRQDSYPETYTETGWGSALGYLRTSELITENEERGLAGVYGFVSAGAHRPVGLSEQEMARLGRSLVSHMCYFLIKLNNSS